jgi:hypothetical protein
MAGASSPVPASMKISGCGTYHHQVSNVVELQKKKKNSTGT